MDIHLTGAEEKMIGVVSSMGSDPRSWESWSALHIVVEENLSEDEFQDAALSAKVIFESYLKDIEGSAFFCSHKYIYVICKNVSEDILDQTGIQIRDLVFGGLYLSAQYRLYSLGGNGEAFVERVLDDLDVPPPSICPFRATHSVMEEDKERQDHENMDTEKRRDPARVLLVEDDAVTRWMVRSSLKDECDFLSAPTAQNVFSLYSSFKPHIVFLDIGLPDNSGDEVLEWIMRNDPTACVVMLSSKDNVDNITGCLEKGAKGFIPKPFIRESLMHYIRTYGCVA